MAKKKGISLDNLKLTETGDNVIDRAIALGIDLCAVPIKSCRFGNCTNCTNPALCGTLQAAIQNAELYRLLDDYNSITPDLSARSRPIGCQYPHGCNIETPCDGNVVFECPRFDSEPMSDMSGRGFSDLGIGTWYPAPKSYDMALITRKFGVLPEYTDDFGLYTISQSIHIDASRYPYVFIRVVIGGIKGFSRGVTLETSISEKDSRVWVVGTPADGYDGDSIVVGNGRITVNGGFHGAVRYPADSKLDGTFIRCGYYPYNAMPMADSVRLCKTYQPGTRIEDKRALRKMLALCPYEVFDI